MQPTAQGCAPTEAVATVTRNRSSTAQMFPFFRRVPNPAKHSLKENLLRNEIDSYILIVSFVILIFNRDYQTKIWIN